MERDVKLRKEGIQGSLNYFNCVRSMFKYYIFAYNATLSDYLTMGDYLAKGDIAKGFVIYDHVSGLATLGLKLHEDSDLHPPVELSQYICRLGTGGVDGEDLDQVFQLEDGLFMAMMRCDLVQTKNLAAERAEYAKRLGIQLVEGKTRVDN